MFAYCENDPVIGKDSNGKLAQWVIGALVGGTIRAVCTALAGGDAINIAQSFAIGLVEGAISGSSKIVKVAIGIFEASLAIYECIDSGVPWNKSLMVGGITLLTSFAYCNDTDALASRVTELTMGMGYSMISTLIKSQIIANGNLKQEHNNMTIVGEGKHYTRPQDRSRLQQNPYIISTLPR